MERPWNGKQFATRKENDMTTTAPAFPATAITVAVRTIAADCDGPTLATLTAAGATVTGRPETLPGGPHAADTIATACADMARLIARHPATLTADVTAYAVILPGERVAFAADRTGTTHHIQLPGVPTEPLRADRWDAMVDSITAMVNAATR
jgi:hypothetical protein